MDKDQNRTQIERALDERLAQINRLRHRPHLKGLDEAAREIASGLRREPSPRNIATARAALEGLRLAGAGFLGYGLEAALSETLQAQDSASPKGATELYADPKFDKTCRIVVPDFEAINAELLAHFARHPEDLQRLNWRKFEELLEAIFRNQGYRTELGLGGGDGGVDLRLIQKDSVGELVTLVQAKRYSAKYPIHLEAVAALYAVVADQEAHRGLFVTTSRYLPSAMEFATRRNQRLVLATSADVALWCRNIISSRHD